MQLTSHPHRERSSLSKLESSANKNAQPLPMFLLVHGNQLYNDYGNADKIAYVLFFFSFVFILRTESFRFAPCITFHPRLTVAFLFPRNKSRHLFCPNARIKTATSRINTSCAVPSCTPPNSILPPFMRAVLPSFVSAEARINEGKIRALSNRPPGSHERRVLFDNACRERRLYRPGDPSDNNAL